MTEVLDMEEIIDRIKSFTIPDVIAVVVYEGDMEDGIPSMIHLPYVSNYRYPLDKELDDTVLLRINPCGGSGVRDKANYEVFWELFGSLDGTYQTYGSDGSCSIVIEPKLLMNKDVYDTLCGLCNYPCIDDRVYSRIEQESIEEAWDDWARSAFEGKVRSRLNLEEIDDGCDEFKALFEEARTTANEYWTEQSQGDMYIDVEGLAKLVKIEDLDRLEIDYTVEEE